MFSQGAITTISKSIAMDASLRRHQIQICFTARKKELTRTALGNSDMAQDL